MRFFASLLTIGLAFAGPPVEGNAKSRVRVLIYEDLQSADCTKFRFKLDAHLLAIYGAHVAFEHHDFPHADHPWARRAAIAARFFDAHNPKLGLEFRRQALSNHDTMTAEDFSSWIAAFARQFAVDPVKAVDALSNPSLAALVDKDVADGVALGIAKAPAVVIDGKPVELESISESIDAAIVAAKKP